MSVTFKLRLGLADSESNDSDLNLSNSSISTTRSLSPNTGGILIGHRDGLRA